ncbi:carbohydrate kinase family protein [Pelagibacterium halotolerans]|uniref:Fructokinase n=1 Tax=Pelagibacterium halotolerans (strain DSM 22347 / JCM 15775 / CGMCC 1.7692 / B2) TaxID=1082931 RepID=G4RCW1_PELHB|nr:carbohydrate kinase [Pelagibacterium halotolerans]AEQ52744.1 fructokinase [Pelagibacterium halotolerans B2]QJR17556.1 carbohydrate kinase [Pelagibacterium halotolerans]SEA77029.1 fructokinase [Pelagibacterium halotolerans]
MFVVAGESLIDLVAKPHKAGTAMEMSAHEGGSPYNCAIALARLGQKAGFLCPISQDTFGDLLMGPLDAAGVVPLIEERSDCNTTLAVVTRNTKGLPAYAFYRKGTAERDISREKLLAALPATIDVFQIGGFLPIEPEDAEIWLDVVRQAAARGAVLSIDPNVRPSLISDFAGYTQRLDGFLDLAHIVKVSDEDLATLDGSMSIEAHAESLLARPNVELVVVTLGEEGSRAFTASAEAKAQIHRPEVFGDTVGAGDSLMAGVLTALAERDALAVGRLGALDGEALGEVLAFGAVTAGLNCGFVGCHPPSRAEVEAVLKGA